MRGNSARTGTAGQNECCLSALFYLRTKGGFIIRGSALEQLVDITNRRYYDRNLAVITKQHTKWLPIRGPDGKIITAKVDEKATVDYRGSIKNKGAVAFDAKETHEDRWYLSRLESHQYEFLSKCFLMGDYAFILIAFWKHNKLFILPFQKYKALKESGVKSLTPEMLAGHETDLQDYLQLLKERSELRQAT